MKLAEALIVRADLQKKAEQLKSRIDDNLIIQEGNTPSEDPKELIKQFQSVQAELKLYIQRINRTNSSVKFDDNMFISDVIAERDMMMNMVDFFNHIVKQGSAKQVRYSNSEIRNVTAIDIGKAQKEADRLSKEYRKLDMALQAKNWTTELL